MAQTTDTPVSGWLRYAIGAIVGLLLGLLIGWWLWPVQWKNVLPPDLRSNERDAYLLMTAESFAQNKDLRLAQERLSAWSPEALAKDLATLQTRLAGTNLQSAGQVQSLIVALNLQPAQAAVPTVKPTAAPSGGAAAAAPSDLLTQLRRLCTLGLWVLLFLGGLALLVFLYRRWRAAQAARGGPAIDRSVIREGAPERPPAQITEEARRAWPGARREELQEPLPAMEWPEREAEEGAAGEEAIPPDFMAPDTTAGQPQRRTPEYRVPSAGVTPPPPPRAAEPTRRPPAPGVVPPGGQPVKLGEWRATYHTGESDYSEAFDINDTDGAYVGYCAMDLMKPVGRNHDQAAALEVSLWDSNDPDTRVAAVMSEGAYRDTATRDQLAGSGQSVVVAKPGAEFTLETYKLLLRGTVDKVSYAEGELPNSIFAELAVRMGVYRKG
jgi:hypothetical protein